MFAHESLFSTDGDLLQRGVQGEEVVGRPGLRFLERIAGRGADVFDAGAEAERVGACRGFPGGVGFVEGGDGVVVDRHREGLALAGLEFAGLGEGLELAGGLLEAARRGAHVELDDFLAGDGAGVGHGDAGFEAIGGSLDDRLAIGKAGVGEAVAERVGDLLAGGAEVAVADIDAFFVVGVVHVLDGLLRAAAEAGVLRAGVVEREVGGGRVVHEVDREGHRELAGRVDLAGQHVSNGVGAFLAGAPGQEDGVDEVLPGVGLDHAADVEHDDDLLAFGVEGGADVLQQGALGGGELEVVHHPAVGALAGVAAEDDDGDIVALRLHVDGFDRDRRLGDARRAAEPVVAGGGQGTARGGQVDGLPVEVYQAGIQREAGVLEGVFHVDDIGFVDVAGAGATRDEVEGGGAVEGDGLGVLDGQRAFVAQQHHRFAGGFPGDRGVGLEVGFVGELVLGEGRGLDDVFEEPTDVAVDVLDVEGAVLDASDDAVDLVLGAGLHQVIAGGGGFDGTRLVAPVGHHDALVAPFIAEDRGEEVLLLLGVFAVDLVVGGHHRPGLAFLDGNLEVLEVDLAQGPLADAGVVLVAVGLLVVGSVVLDGGADVVFLDAADVGGSHLAGEERVFGEILEVSAAQRVAVDVHARGEEHVHAVFVDFIAHRGRHFFHEGGVPRAGEQGPYRETGAVESLVRPDAGRADAQPRRAVRQDGAGDAQARDRAGVAGRAGHLVDGAGGDAVHHRRPRAAHHQCRFLLKGHGLEDFVDIVFPQLRRLLCQRSQRPRHRRQNHQGSLHINWFL